MADLNKPTDDWMISYIDDLLLDESAEDELPVEAPPAAKTSPTAAANAHSTAAAGATPLATAGPSRPAMAAAAAASRVSEFVEPTPSANPAVNNLAQVPELAEEESRKQQLQRLLHVSNLRNSVSKPAAPVAAPPIFEAPIPEAPIPQAKTEAALEPAIVSVPAKVGVAKPEPVTPSSEPELAQESEFELAQPALPQWRNGRPDWAQDRFDVLLFTVSKLTLAVPLICLGQIQKISDELTPLFGQSDWFMGLLPTAHGKIRCVDTALFVMPERYQPEFRENYRFLITINGLPWGLAVDEVKQPIQLDPESVNWRGVRTKRPWLAGTIRDHMCALLDIPVLGQLLAEQDKNRRQ
ncbi:chemotaxis protein CheW [Halioxenophilus sp. WMMB6]|uniref:chemotaxis protein CheW n=1 Tax=Halioxenophilus sp. WMMB6 TaxID=3073815 RepID=UPI00295EC179|nr:chemotaxis protein CheW [Halioxenophilus sp. WMMB6]